MKNLNLKEVIVTGVAMVIVSKIIQSLGGVIEGNESGGLGHDKHSRDENKKKLFLDACAYSIENEFLNDDELIRILNVFSGYSSKDFGKILDIMGRGEGVKIIEMLSKFKDEDIKVILDTVVSPANSSDNSLMGKCLKKIQSSFSEFKEDADNFFLKETWLEAKVKQMEEREKRKK